MYRTYAAGIGGDIFDGKDTESSVQSDSDEDLWVRIDKNVAHHREQMKETLSREAEDSPFFSRGWLPLRLFVSSTFKDFHSEREILVKHVFPELREWCAERKIFLMECDLRWGVPQNSSGADTVLACMDMLDQCNKETENRAFFLNMIGERYGWEPGQSDLPGEILNRYDWLTGASVTLMEILIGALRTGSPNALFMIRNQEKLVKQIEDAKLRVNFVESNSTSASKVHKLRDELSRRFKETPQIGHYTAEYDGIDKSGRKPRVKISGLESEFANKVLEFFKDAISATYPSREPGQGDMEEDESDTVHESIMGSLTYMTGGQEKTLNSLEKYLETGILEDGRLCELEENDSGKVFDRGTPSMCLIGGSGSGKSTMLARLAKRGHSQGGKSMFCHFVDATESSSTTEDVVRRMKSFLHQLMKENDLRVERTNVDIYYYLEKLQEVDKMVVCFIDGIDHLEAHVKSHIWLPHNWPANFRCILSCNSQSLPWLAALEKKSVILLDIEPLNKPDRISVVENFFSEYGKRLDDEQLNSLVAKENAGLPLWLSLACEELRVYGDYYTLTKTIQSLPADSAQLSVVILDRVLKEDKTNGLVANFLKILLVARLGVWEEAARCLLADEDEEQISLTTWYMVLRPLRPFLMITASSGILVKDRSLRESLVTRLFPGEPLGTHPEAAQWHKLCANYYQHKCKVTNLRCRETPFHLFQADCRKELLKIMRSRDHISLKLSPILRGQISAAWRCERAADQGNVVAQIICQFCAKSGSVFGFAGGSNDSTCVLCGRFIGHSSTRGGEANLCMSHGGDQQRQKKCLACGRVAPDAKRTSPALVCVFCQQQAGQCCALVTEDDKFHFSSQRRKRLYKQVFW